MARLCRPRPAGSGGDAREAAPQVDRAKAVRAEHERDFAAVIGIVGDETQEDGLARVDLDLAAANAARFLAERVEGPRPKAVLDDRPGRLEGVHELARPPRVLEVVLPADAA